LLIEEQAHGDLRRWNARAAALALGGVGETRPYVLLRQLRKISQQVRLGHPARQVSEHIANRNPCPSDTWLSEPHCWIDRDAFKKGHGEPSVYGREHGAGNIVARFSWGEALDTLVPG
jgi:hypothetical protein